MAIPRITTEIAFATAATVDPTRADTAWKDISDYVHPPLTVSAGRQRELERFQPGTASFTLDNRDRRFDPENTAGPYYPNVVPMRHVRLISGYLGEVLKRKPVRYYRLSDGAGASSAAAEVGAAAGTYNGSPTLSTPGLIAGRTCLNADGSDDYVNIADHAELDLTSSWSIAFWIDPDTVAQKGLVVRATAGSSNPVDGYVVRLLATGEVQYETATRTPTVSTSSAGITAGGGLYCVVVTFDNAASPKCRIYVNAVERGSGNPPAPVNLAVPLLIAREGPAATFFDGQIGEVALFTTVLSQADVTRLYDEGTKRVADGDLFRGFVDGWPQQWPDENDAVVQMHCTDAFRVLAGIDLPVSLWELEVRETAPKSWWRLGETEDSPTVLDTVANYVGDVLGTPTFGQESLVAFDSDTALLFTGAAATFVQIPETAVITTGDFVIACWIKTSETSGSIGRMIYDQSPDDLLGYTYMHVDVGGAAGNVRWVQQPLGGSFTILSTSGVNVADDRKHFVVFRRSTSDDTVKIYIDGIEKASAAETDNGGYGATSAFIGNLKTGTGPSSSALFGGVIDEFLLFGTALSPTTIATLYAAGAAPFSGKRTDEAITRVLDYIDWPATLRNIDQGISLLQAVALGGSALEFIQRLEATEEGMLFVAPDGKLRFRNRHSNLLTPGNTSQATFSDDPAADPGSLSYRELVFDYDDGRIINEARLARTGGAPVSVSDAPSKTAYLPHVFERSDLEHQSDLDVFDHATWIVSRRKDPQVEVTTLVFSPEIDAVGTGPHWAQALGRAIGDLITVKRRPPGGGAPMNREVRIEGVEHKWDGPGWETKWRLSAADTTRYWILGDATYGLLGSSTRLGF
jgi:hypothetical protein